MYNVCWADLFVSTDADSSVIGFIASCNTSSVSDGLELRAEETHDVHITKLIQPKIVDSIGCSHEVACFELSVNLSGCRVQLV